MDLTDWQSPERDPSIGQSLAGMDASTPGANTHLATLTRAIETEVIPRLLRARRPNATGRAGWMPDAGEVDHFARLLIDREEDLAFRHLQALIGQGVPLETLYGTLLSGAALHLGRLWEEDLVDFTAVSTGVWRLQKMLRQFSDDFVGPDTAASGVHRILLMPMTGGQHSFGLALVAEYFRRARWDVACEIARSEAELVAFVGESRFDVLGLSVGSDQQLDALTRTIAAVRRRSVNPRITVMVGGPIFVMNPGLAAQVGADATTADAAQAPGEAARLVATAIGQSYAQAASA